MRKPLAVLAATLAVYILLALPAAGVLAADRKLNPYTGNATAIKEGRALYLQQGCSACHGVLGGGGMATPLNDETWKFGSSDEVLFKLIKGEIAESTMPKTWQALDADEVWKMLAYTRSIYTGDPSKVDW